MSWSTNQIFCPGKRLRDDTGNDTLSDIDLTTGATGFDGLLMPSARLADVHHFRDRTFAKLLLVIDIFFRGVQLVVPQHVFDLLEGRFGIVVDARAGAPGVVGAKFSCPTRAA